MRQVSCVCKNHLNQHSEGVQEGLICELCGYAASRKDKLKRHIKTVHKVTDKTFKCPLRSITETKVLNVKNVHFHLLVILIWSNTLRECMERLGATNVMSVDMPQTKKMIC